MKSRQIILASNNPGKIKEISALLPDFDIVPAKNTGVTEWAEETGQTLEENAYLKAIHFKNYDFVLADDSGLFVSSLNGAPGIYSARYAGENSSDEENVQKLLLEMKYCTERSACFTTVICLIENNQVHYFDGTLNGSITYEPKGKNGFGYDPVFIPDGYHKTLAEMTQGEKNRISHRKKALDKLKSFLAKNALPES